MIKKSGANYVILGHSENRLEGETNKIIKKKIETSLKHGLNVIFCIGETNKERIAKKTFKVLTSQIRGSLHKKNKFSKIILAYEPVWSIGTGKIPRVHDLKIIIRYIKKEFNKMFKNEIAVKMLYGGSVNGKNISLFSSINEIDGFLIGGSSQSSNKFIDIMKKYDK